MNNLNRESFRKKLFKTKNHKKTNLQDVFI